MLAFEHWRRPAGGKCPHLPAAASALAILNYQKRSPKEHAANSYGRFPTH